MNVAIRTRTGAITLLVIAPLLLTACGDSSVGADEQVLDQTTSQEIFFELSSQIMGIAFGAFKSDAGVPLPAATAEDLPISVTADCTSGGTVTVNGVISSLGTDNSGTVGFDLRQKPSGCAIETSMGTIVVDGNPDLRITANVQIRNGEPVGEFILGYQGGFKWNGADGAGSCMVDMSYSINVETEEFSIRGSMCGNNLNWSV